MTSRTSTPEFGKLIQNFFCQRLQEQRAASDQTIAAYRDAFCLLIRYLEVERKKSPTVLTLADLDAPVVLDFLNYLEKTRGNSVRTRNARLAAIRSFLKYAVAHAPSALPSIQRTLSIPMKRFTKPMLGFLSRDEIAAILDAPDHLTWSGQRDRALFALLYNTGARVSEAIALRRQDVAIERTRCVRIRGKGRKERTVPLWKGTSAQLEIWMRQIQPAPESPLFPNNRGQRLSRSGVEDRLQKAVQSAFEKCPSLRNKEISPHTLRHSTAMHLLQSGVDITVIALWLGHESTETTHHYIEADLDMKSKALAKVEEIPLRQFRFRGSEGVLKFLESL